MNSLKPAARKSYAKRRLRWISPAGRYSGVTVERLTTAADVSSASVGGRKNDWLNFMNVRYSRARASQETWSRDRE